MRKFIILAIIAFLMASCGGEKTTLEQLVEKRDSLKTESNELRDELAKVEAEIAKLDTTKKLTQVTAVEVAPRSYEHHFEVYGNVEAPENVLLTAQAGGEVMSIPVKEGQQVKKGQLLVKVDADVTRKNMEEVRNSLSLAKDVFERQERLWNQNIGSQMQYLEAKNNKEALEKKLETLEAQLKLASAVAPIDGIIDEIYPNVGEVASPGAPLVRIVNLNEVYIKADVSERYLGVVKEGTKVEVEFPALNLTIDTIVSLTGNYINPENRTFVVRIDIDNDNQKIKPNLMAKLNIRDFKADSVIVLSSNIIQQTPNGDNFVYTVSAPQGEAEVKKVSIKAGSSNAKTETMIDTGLVGGEIIVDQGSRSIKDGQKVEVIQK